jgi:hypothetical protein
VHHDRFVDRDLTKRGLRAGYRKAEYRDSNDDTSDTGSVANSIASLPLQHNSQQPAGNQQHALLSVAASLPLFPIPGQQAGQPGGGSVFVPAPPRAAFAASAQQPQTVHNASDLQPAAPGTMGGHQMFSPSPMGALLGLRAVQGT